jgi:hypothetical protein
VAPKDGGGEALTQEGHDHLCAGTELGDREWQVWRAATSGRRCGSRDGERATGGDPVARGLEALLGAAARRFGGSGSG